MATCVRQLDELAASEKDAESDDSASSNIQSFAEVAHQVHGKKPFKRYPKRK